MIPQELLTDIGRGTYNHDLFWLAALGYGALDGKICKHCQILPVPLHIIKQTEDVFNDFELADISGR